jgi:outer membrane protein assembly factor BamB
VRFGGDCRNFNTSLKDDEGVNVSFPVDAARIFLATALTLVVIAPMALAQQNWHHWRGPQENGYAPDANPPLQWNGEDDTNIKWKVAIPGRGSGTPIVSGRHVYVLTAVPNESAEEGAHDFNVMCLDRGTGALVWQKTATTAVPHERLHPTNTYASASPTTDGKHLYVSFGSFGIFCFDMSGNEIWSRDLGDMQTRNEFGEGTSPVLYGDSLVINWDHEGPSFIAVLDANTGETRWQEPRDEVTTWNTPLVTEAAGRTQVIVNATNFARSYDLASGEVIWQCGGQVTNCIPSPIRYNDVVFCMSGYRGAELYAIPLDSQGDVSNSPSLAWVRHEGTPYVPSALLYGDRLYFNKGNNGVVSCLNAATGEPLVDQKRLAGISSIYASPVGAAGRVYYTGRDGATVVIRHADELEILATNPLGEAVDASPAVVDNQIFLRGERNLYCIAGD